MKKAEFIDHSIMVVDTGITWCDDLIEVSERKNLWTDGRRSLPQEDDAYLYYSLSDAAKNDKELTLWNKLLFETFLGALNEYTTKHEFARIEKDTGYSVLKYDVGGSYMRHIDGGFVGKGGLWFVVSALLYLNQTEGGSLYFPVQDLEVTPKPGVLVMFPSNYAYPHESRRVVAGRKYAVATMMGVAANP